MTISIELANQCGITYYLTPEGTTEMHGTDRAIEAFADAVRAAERTKERNRFISIVAYNTDIEGICAADDIFRALGDE